MRRISRHHAVHLLVLCSAACGGGTGDGTGDGPGPDEPTRITVASGSLGSARYGTRLSPSPTVLVRGESGPLQDVRVTFTVREGAGTLAGGTDVTNADGIATVPEWTLGSSPGLNVVRATAGSAWTDIEALATAGPASVATAVAGDGQEWVEGGTVPVRPAVRVSDGTFPVSGVPVSFAVTGGSGRLTIDHVTTDREGVASVGSWRLGTVGANTLSATVAGIPEPVVFRATAVPMVVSAIVPVAGDAQTGFANNFAARQPVVEVLNQYDQPAEGVVVAFSTAGGGGTISQAVDTTGPDGRAALGAWRFGPAGPQALSASAGGNVTTFSATVTPAPSSALAIEVRYTGTPPDPALQAHFTTAAARWSEIIVGDLPASTADLSGIYLNLGPDLGGFIPCSPPLAGSDAQIDDMVVFARVMVIDGPGGILGAATQGHARADGTTITGCMILDAGDLELMAANGIVVDVILHEMGHIIGIGSAWRDSGLLVGGCPTPWLKPYFIGESARQAFRASLTAAFPDSIVPVEGGLNGVLMPCGSGTRDSHWREDVMGSELMTGFVNEGQNPLSVITAAAIRDLGYVVNDAASDGFSLIRAPALRSPADRVMLRELDLTGRRYLIDADGRPMRIW